MTTEALREIPLERVRRRVGRGERERYLLAVDEDVLSCRERQFDPRASIVEMGLEVSRGDIHDVDPCDGHVWVVDWGEPWDVDDLDEVGDAVFPEEVGVGDGSKGAEPEVTRVLGRGREGDLVHWCAHRLDDFWREVVKPDHLLPLSFAARPLVSPSSLSPLHPYKPSALPRLSRSRPRPASPGKPFLFWLPRLICLSPASHWPAPSPDSLLHPHVQRNKGW